MRAMAGLLLGLWLALAASPASAQNLCDNYGAKNCNAGAAAAASYQGPGDIASGAIAFYSAGRAYNAAYAASNGNLADLVATGNGAAVCTLKALSTGYVNLTATACSGSTPAAACAAANGGACSVTKLYDQTGNGNDVVQATLANMPGLTLSAQNGLPCAAGTGVNTVNLSTAGSLSQAAPYTITAVTERTGSFTTLQDIMANLNGPGRYLFVNATNSIRANNGTPITLTASDNAFHALLAVASATAPLFAIDSSANISTLSNGSTSLTNPQTFMNSQSGGTLGVLSGFVCEAGIWPADLNSSYQAMLANMRSATNGWNF